MFFAIAIHERDDIPHLIGPFGDEREAQIWIELQKDDGFMYHITEPVSPIDFEESR